MQYIITIVAINVRTQIWPQIISNLGYGKIMDLYKTVVFPNIN